MTKIIALLLCLCVQLLATPITSRTISKIASMQIRQDGSFDVICINGNYEILNVVDIASDKICGAPTAVKPITGMRSAIRKNSFLFEVLCTNDTTETHTAGSIKSGTPCFSINKDFLLGTHNATSNYDTLNPNLLYFIKVKTTKPMKLSGWGLYARLQRDPLLVMGIYSNLANKPDKLLLQSEEFEVSEERIYLGNSKDETLPAGEYFFAYVTDNLLTLFSNRHASNILIGQVSFRYKDKLPSQINPQEYIEKSVSESPQIFAYGTYL